MLHLSMILVAILWVIAIFSFAKWRAASICAKGQSISVLNDVAFQLFSKLSGLGVLAWFYLMLMNT